MVSELVLLRPASVPTDDGFYVQVGKGRKKDSFISDLRDFVSRCFSFPHPQVIVGEDGDVVITGLYEGIPDGADYNHETFDHILDLVGWIEGCVELPTGSEIFAPKVPEQMPMDEPLVVQIGSTLKPDGEHVQTEAKIEHILMKKSSYFDAHQVLDELPEPQEHMKQVILKIVETGASFDPGGKQSIVVNELLQPIAHQLFDEMSKRKNCLEPELRVEMVINELSKPQQQGKLADLKTLLVLMITGEFAFDPGIIYDKEWARRVAFAHDPGGGLYTSETGLRTSHFISVKENVASYLVLVYFSTEIETHLFGSIICSVKFCFDPGGAWYTTSEVALSIKLLASKEACFDPGGTCLRFFEEEYLRIYIFLCVIVVTKIVTSTETYETGNGICYAATSLPRPRLADVGKLALDLRTTIDVDQFVGHALVGCTALLLVLYLRVSAGYLRPTYEALIHLKMLEGIFIYVVPNHSLLLLLASQLHMSESPLLKGNLLHHVFVMIPTLSTRHYSPPFVQILGGYKLDILTLVYSLSSCAPCFDEFPFEYYIVYKDQGGTICIVVNEHNMTCAAALKFFSTERGTFSVLVFDPGISLQEEWEINAEIVPVFCGSVSFKDNAEFDDVNGHDPGALESGQVKMSFRFHKLVLEIDLFGSSNPLGVFCFDPGRDNELLLEEFGDLHLPKLEHVGELLQLRLGRDYFASECDQLIEYDRDAGSLMIMSSKNSSLSNVLSSLRTRMFRRGSIVTGHLYIIPVQFNFHVLGFIISGSMLFGLGS